MDRPPARSGRAVRSPGPSLAPGIAGTVMPENQQQEKKAAKPIGGDFIIPLMALSFTLYYFSTIWDLKWEAKLNGFLMGSVLLFLVLIFFVRSALRILRENATLGLGQLWHPVSVQKTRAALLILSIAFIYFIPWLGFTISITLFMVLALWLLGSRRPRVLIGIPLLLASSGYLLFIQALDSRLPHGPFEKFITWIL